MSWAVEDFIRGVVRSLNGQGYRVEALEDPRPLGGNGGAWRCRMVSPEEGMPASVILKQATSELEWRWQDWSCQYFISDLAGTKGLGPEFFAGDEQVGYYLLEDLGLGSDLRGTLGLEDSRSRLAAGLLACALAGLHAGTFGRERTFGLLRERLPGRGPDRGGEQADWVARVAGQLSSLQPGLERELEGVLETLAVEMADPREFLTLTHGDWDCANLWYGDIGPRFLDFRRGAYRHALLDLAAWELRCHPSPRAQETLWREYLEELNRLGAERGPRFAQAHARARGWMALERLADGAHTPAVRDQLLQAAAAPGLEPLNAVAGLL